MVSGLRFHQLIYSQKLAFHTKRITIMCSDMECLRDLWSTINPECCIRRESQLTLETYERESRKQRHKVSKLVKAAKKKARVAQGNGHQVDKRTVHFLKSRL
jgi:hypothetical protein